MFEMETEFIMETEFPRFKEKVESIFGPLEKLAARAPDVYAHQVLSHGFMEYSFGLNLIDNASELATVAKGDASSPEREALFHGVLKTVYLDWARANSLPEHLLEYGWQEFLHD